MHSLTGICILVLLTVSCGAQMVSRPGAVGRAGTKYAPINEAEVSRSGVIKYLNEGDDYFKVKRRDDAYKQMYESCGGSYHIDSEGPRVEGGTVVPIGDISVVTTSQYWYIQFSCASD